jgi:hypothetical protein
MAEQGQGPGQSGSAVRFEASVHLGAAGAVRLERVADLDLDRIPGPPGEVRVLVDLDACARLVESGFEVRLHRALPVRPLDPALIADDERVRAWLTGRLPAIGEAEGS